MALRRRPDRDSDRYSTVGSSGSTAVGLRRANLALAGKRYSLNAVRALVKILIMVDNVNKMNSQKSNSSSEIVRLLKRISEKKPSMLRRPPPDSSSGSDDSSLTDGLSSLRIGNSLDSAAAILTNYDDGFDLIFNCQKNERCIFKENHHKKGNEKIFLNRTLYPELRMHRSLRDNKYEEEKFCLLPPETSIRQEGFMSNREERAHRISSEPSSSEGWEGDNVDQLMFRFSEKVKTLNRQMLMIMHTLMDEFGRLQKPGDSDTSTSAEVKTMENRQQKESDQTEQ